MTDSTSGSPARWPKVCHSGAITTNPSPAILSHISLYPGSRPLKECISTIPGCFPAEDGAAIYAGYIFPAAVIVVMLPGTGPEIVPGVVTVAVLSSRVFVQPERNTPAIRRHEQRARIHGLFI